MLRSLNKSATKVIPENFKGSFAEDLVAELNSASHPYGALTFPTLAKSIGVPVPKPELFFVPDDPALGLYRPLFANNVCMLEEKNAAPGGGDTKTTAKVFDKMLDENDHLPDQPMVLRARLLDILTGDFDRHFDPMEMGDQRYRQRKDLLSDPPRQRPGLFQFRWSFDKSGKRPCNAFPERIQVYDSKCELAGLYRP